MTFLSCTLLRAGPSRGEPAWSDVTSCLAHWESLSQLYTSIESRLAVRSRLDAENNPIRSPQAIYTQLQASGVYCEAATGPDHVPSWLDALAAFRQEASV